MNKAYHLINRNQHTQNPEHRPYGVSSIVWNKIWKVKLPPKILTFIWKILQESLPVFEVLNNRGILASSNCLLCNEEKESLDHLFMKCPFTRAIWLGSNLAISGYAYEAKTLDGNELFSGGASCGQKTQQLAIQDAVGEAIFKPMQMGYNKILVSRLCKCELWYKVVPNYVVLAQFIQKY